MTYKIVFVDKNGTPLTGTFYYKSSTGGVRGFVSVSGTDTTFDDSDIASETSYFEAVVPGYPAIQTSALTDSMRFTFEQPVGGLALVVIGAAMLFGLFAVVKN